MTDYPSLISSPKQLISRQSARWLCAACVPDFREGVALARRVGQIVSRGRQRWLVRVFLGRDRETRRRRYHNRTIHGSARRAQEYLTRMLRERDLGRGLEGSESR